MMDPAEEKFFEDLTKLGTAHEEGAEPEVELVKAASVSRERAVKREFPASHEPEGQLTIDVYQTPSEIIVESAIAGVKSEDLDINVSTDSVVIRGERRRETELKEEDYLYQECYWGRFSRSVILPQEVNPDGAVVRFKNGILTIHLPKLNRERSKKLKVKTE